LRKSVALLIGFGDLIYPLNYLFLRYYLKRHTHFFICMERMYSVSVERSSWLSSSVEATNFTVLRGSRVREYNSIRKVVKWCVIATVVITIGVGIAEKTWWFIHYIRQGGTEWNIAERMREIIHNEVALLALDIFASISFFYRLASLFVTAICCCLICYTHINEMNAFLNGLSKQNLSEEEKLRQTLQQHMQLNIEVQNSSRLLQNLIGVFINITLISVVNIFSGWVFASLTVQRFFSNAGDFLINYFICVIIVLFAARVSYRYSSVSITLCEMYGRGQVRLSTESITMLVSYLNSNRTSLTVWGSAINYTRIIQVLFLMVTILLVIGVKKYDVSTPD